MSDDELRRLFSSPPSPPHNSDAGDESARQPQRGEHSDDRTRAAGSDRHSSSGRSRSSSSHRKSSQRRRSSSRRRRRRALWWTLGGVGALVLLTVAAGAWLGTRGWQAFQEVTAARAAIAGVAASAMSTNPVDDAPGSAFSGLQIGLATAGAHLETARELTSDPVWAAAGHLPWIGSNFSVTRDLIAVADDTVTAAAPMASELEGFSISNLTPVDGVIPVGPMQSLITTLASFNDEIQPLNERAASIDSSGTIAQLDDATTQVTELLGQVSAATATAAGMGDSLPWLLGDDAPRTYLLLFQNNAEAVSLGGNTAAWMILTVDGGQLEISAQYNSRDFSNGDGTPIAIDPELDALYGGLFRFATNTTLRPDFPTSAALAQGYLNRVGGPTVDGVIALDPVALSYLLAATGPIQLADGTQITSENAVAELLNTVYTRYSDPALQDAFFADAASSIFNELTRSVDSPAALIQSLARAGEERRLLVFSSNADVQQSLIDIGLSGTFAATSDDSTQVGVFLIENSSSKMSFYQTSQATVSRTSCAAGDDLVVSVTLHQVLSAEEFQNLPSYVAPANYPDYTRTMVLVYGPPGGTFAEWEWDSGGLDATLVRTGNDLGRPVALFTLDLQPEQSGTITASFTQSAEASAPLQALVTPMVRPMDVLLNDGCNP